MKCDRDRSYSDELASYSATDLIDALHWTSKKDLLECISNPLDGSHLWDKLSEADKGLQQFYVYELVKIIRLHKQEKQ